MSQIILILAPVGKDADVAVSVLRNAGVVSQSCQSVSELCERLRAKENSVGALVLTEEALLKNPARRDFVEQLKHLLPLPLDLPLWLRYEPTARSARCRRRIRIAKSISRLRPRRDAYSQISWIPFKAPINSFKILLL
jgi:hypothetical protein